VVATAVNGQLSGKLKDLGLTPQQADAVLALSREVVERNRLGSRAASSPKRSSKEEITRLTKE